MTEHFSKVNVWPGCHLFVLTPQQRLKNSCRHQSAHERCQELAGGRAHLDARVKTLLIQQTCEEQRR